MVRTVIYKQGEVEENNYNIDENLDRKKIKRFSPRTRDVRSNRLVATDIFLYTVLNVLLTAFLRQYNGWHQRIHPDTG